MRVVVVLFMLVSCTPVFAAPNVVEFQKFKEKTDLRIGSNEIELINLNKNISSWYLITLKVPKQNPVTLNIQTNARLVKEVVLNPDVPTGVMVEKLDGTKAPCGIFDQAVLKKQGKQGYEMICNNLIAIRFDQPVAATFSASGIADSIRGATTWMGLAGLGEDIANFGKLIVNTVDSPEIKEKVGQGSVEDKQKLVQGPPGANVQKEGTTIGRTSLGIELNETVLPKDKQMLAGQWYPTKNFPGVYVSIINPQMVPASVLASYPTHVGALNEQEKNAAVNIVAFDLTQFTFGWSRGSDLDVAWSPMYYGTRPTPGGPDGFGDLKELMAPGYVPSMYMPQTVAVFSGGFHRKHSFFLHGERSKTNTGNHYGFMEEGVLMSTLHKDLASFIIYKNGDVALHPWSQADEDNITQIRHVRQNGIAPIEYDAQNNQTVPHPYSKDSNLSNYWAGINNLTCVARGVAFTMENNGKKFLAYAYFSSATPNAIARVLQAYGATGAIHLDMNSAYNAYFSMVHFLNNSFKVELLANDMNGGNKSVTIDNKATVAPRYLVTPDKRDIFYVYKKN